MFKINGERRLFKDNNEVSIVSLEEAASNFLSFISQSVDRAKSQTNKSSKRSSLVTTRQPLTLLYFEAILVLISLKDYKKVWC